MRKTLAFFMLITYLSALLVPCFAKAEGELCYEFEQQKSKTESKTEAEVDDLLKEFIHLPSFFQDFLAILNAKNLEIKQANYTYLPMNFQGKNSSIFSPPPEFYFFS